MNESLIKPSISSETVTYGFHCTIDVQDFRQAVEHVIAALNTEGFGV